jgi:hypothetical protein
MANSLQWGTLPFNQVNGLSSSWVDDGSGKNKNTANLVEGFQVVRPANEVKSKAGKAQYDSKDSIVLETSVATFLPGKLVCQTKHTAIGSLFNYESPKAEEDLKAWVKDGCRLIIVTTGNKQLEFYESVLSGRLLDGNLTIFPNGNFELPTDEEKSLIKEILASPESDWEDGDKELLDKYFIPSTTFDAGSKVIYEKIFGYSILSEDELKSQSDKIDIGKSASNSSGNKSGSRASGGSTVNVYQNETSLDKFQSFIKMLGLPETSTLIDSLPLVFSGKIPLVAFDLAIAFAGLQPFSIEDYQEVLHSLPVEKSELVTPVDKIENPVTENPSDKSTSDKSVISITNKLIRENLRGRGQLPKDWEIGNPTTTWCELITSIINKHDVTDIEFKSSVNLVMKDAKKSSLVLYTEEELAMINESL